MKYQELVKTEIAISLVKKTFAAALAEQLQLVEVSAPLVVLAGTGINDDLNGIERPVAFPIKALEEKNAVVVHSLAKWKRQRLKDWKVAEGTGILTDMRALRPDEDYSALHSIYVDQWDWEKHIAVADRNLAYLKQTVETIYQVLRKTEQVVYESDASLPPILPESIFFIHAEELLQLYPDLTPKDRENAITKQHGAVFIIGIGGKLSDGMRHDGRAADYDDWTTQNEDGYAGLNGDLLLWNPVLACAFEISSMGIRVDQATMLAQLKEHDCLERSELAFHHALLAGELPQSIGGGIGQSRVCMFLLRKSHIGEVQVGIWPENVRKELLLEGVTLL